MCGTLAWKNVGPRTHPTLQQAQDYNVENQQHHPTTSSWDGRESSVSRGVSWSKKGGAIAAGGDSRRDGAGGGDTEEGTAGRGQGSCPIRVSETSARRISGNSSRAADVDNSSSETAHMEHGTAGALSEAADSKHIPAPETLEVRSRLERNPKSERSPASPNWGGATQEDEDFFSKHVALETPLQQVRYAFITFESALWMDMTILLRHRC